MIKKILITILVLNIIILAGCVNLNDYVTKEEYNSLKDTLDNTIDEYSSLREEYNNLKAYSYELENELNKVSGEKDKYVELISSLNDLLSNVYYGYGENSEYFGEFTAFSIEYQNKYFILTAGHCVESNGIKYNKFKFKSTFGNNWIYPKLLSYNNDYNSRNDYAIFYSDKIKDGFIIDNEGDEPKYILGNNKSSTNIIRSYYDKTFNGESGSPIIDYEGEISGISTTDIHSYFTNIYTILEAIDNLE